LPSRISSGCTDATNQINNNQTGYSIGVLPGPPWGLVEGFYSSHSTTPSINLVYTITPTLINDLTFGINHWDEPGGPNDNTQLAKAQRKTYGLQSLGQWYPGANAYDYLPIMAFSDVPSAAGFFIRLSYSHQRCDHHLYPSPTI